MRFYAEEGGTPSTPKNRLQIFLWHLVPWPSIDMHRKFYADRPRGTPLTGELNPRGVAKYSDFGPIEAYLGNGARYEVS